MGIISSAFTGGQWKSWNENNWLEDNTPIERVKFRWANPPANGNILYWVKYWDDTAGSFVWTPPRFGEEEAGRPGTEIYGLGFMLTGAQDLQAQVFVSIKTRWVWHASRAAFAESINPIIGLQVVIGEP